MRKLKEFINTKIPFLTYDKINEFKNYINNYDLNTDVKFLLLGGGIMHLVFLAYAIILNVKEFWLYEFTAFLYFIFLHKTWKGSKLFVYCVLAYAEITLHSIYAYYILGDTCSMELFFVSLIPVVSLVSFDDCSKIIKRVFLCFICAYSIVCYVFMPEFCQKYIVTYYHPNVFIRLTFKVATVSMSILLLFLLMYMFVIRLNKSMKIIQKEKNEIEAEAYTDPLTGLINRRKMLRAIKNYEDNYAKKPFNYTIAIGDIDFFKSINDEKGHSAGDFVLKTLADIFRSSLRENDYICRWGGEEFLFLLKCGEKDAQMVLERLRQKIEKNELIFNDNKFSVTMTFGICEKSGDNNVSQMIDIADSRLYYGKKNGRNRVIVSDNEFGGKQKF